jgi:hypothetical protein
VETGFYIQQRLLKQCVWLLQSTGG